VTFTWLGEYQQRASWQRHHIAHYLPILFGTAARYPGARIVELGTDAGDSTVALLAAAELAAGHVWSVDINPDCLFASTFYSKCPGPWTFINGNSTHRGTAERTPPQIDVLFIDSSHEYEQTRQELWLWLPRMAPGGVVMLHDTNKPGTHDKVREALDEALPGRGLSWYEHPGDNGLGVVDIPR
jgi:predicted O-methyltransferase YrrM